MAYSDLDANQGISFNNLQSGVSQGYFVAKTSIPSGLKEINKSEANTYVYLNASIPSYASKSSNQLVTKNDLSGITSAYPYLMYGVAGTSGYISTDGGNTFSSISGLPSLAWTGIAGDSSGTYIAAICYTQNNQIYISSNGGSSFSAVTISSVLVGFYPTGVSMSADGQYISVSGYSTTPDYGGNRNARIAVSNNYGASFGSGSYTDGTGLNLISGYDNTSGKIAVSGNGQYMTAVFAYRVLPAGVGSYARPWSFRVYSTNYGASWTKSSTSEFCLFLDIALNYTGQYQFITSDYFEPGLTGAIGIKAFVSNNYGSGWSERFSNTTAYYGGGRSYSGFASATMSDDGKTMVGASNGLVSFELASSTLPPSAVTSTNYGGGFSSTDGYNGNRGIAGGDVTTSGVTNNYIPMMLYNVAQFNYSKDGGATFTPTSSTSIAWKQIYRKAFLY